MGKLKNNQKGFSAIEAIMLVVIVALIGAVGWMVYKDRHKTTVTTTTTQPTKTSSTPTSQQPTANTTTYTDSSKLFTISYPTSWAVDESAINAETPYPLANKKRVKLTPPNSPKSSDGVTPNAVFVIAFKTSDIQGVLSHNSFGDKQTSTQSLTINGYQALYNQDISTGATESPTYTEDQYVVTNNGATLLVTFREKEGSYNSVPAFDVTSTVPDFTALVKSVKFLN